MTQKKKQTVPKGKAGQVRGPELSGRRVSVDIVTGLEVNSVYFDPDEAIPGETSEDSWQSRYEHLYEPGVVLRDHGNDVISVKLGNGDVFKMNSKAAVKVTVQDDEGVDDILRLRDFSEMSLIHTLRTRYARDDIYTSVGPILISINPYKWMKGYYDEATMVAYHGQEAHAMPPHLFAVADGAYNLMMDSGSLPRARSQSIIISGESGAGKTEATKVIMQYLAKITTTSAAAAAAAGTEGSAATTTSSVSAAAMAAATPSAAEGLVESMRTIHNRTGSPRMTVGDLEQRVLDSNPMLEAFGNARTLRNDNSSRFGKFIKIQFSKKGRIIGASIEKYLLEKTRINNQVEGERNFHVFYQLVRGAPAALRAQLRLQGSDADGYRYLADLPAATPGAQLTEVEEEFELTCQCMASVGIGEETRHEIFSAIAGIVHLGNVDFTSDGPETIARGVAGPASQAALQAAAEALGLQTDELLTAVTKQNMHVDKQVIVKQLTHSQAIEKRDSLARCIYSALFNWLVDKINYSITAVDSVWAFIGVLDIYGFENFHTNGFEQLLINYANEKLQSHFNKHIFQIEQAEYEAEGIDWSYVTFYDNQPCVELIDGRPNNKSGIFQTLDDASGTNRMDVNSSFLAQINMSWSECKGSLTTRHPNYLAPRFNSDCIFGVQHYAGEVFYNIAHFAEKNRDSTSNDLRELLLRSSNELLKDAVENCSGETVTSSKALPPAAQTAGKGSAPTGIPVNTAAAKRNAVVSKLKEDSISKQFCTSLKLLSDTLDSTDPHFVRCMKPNSRKCPNLLHAVDLRTQLRNAGMMETIRIRKQGYASRHPHKEFFQRYHPLAPRCSTLRQLVDELSKVLAVSAEAWQVGTTKIFIKSHMSVQLDRLLLLRCSVSAKRIQKAWRARRRYFAARAIQTFARKVVARRHFLRVVRMAVRLQASLRRHRASKHLRAARRAAVRIQAVARAKAARLAARRLHNPYSRLNYDELTAALEQAEADLEGACFLKDFEACETIEQSIRDILAARVKHPLPVRVPATRRELDLYLLENKFALDYATAAQDLSMCAKLQAQRTQLEAHKGTLQTVEECRDALSAASAALAEAMAKKEFKRCVGLQAGVTAAEAALAAAVRAGAHACRVPVPTLRERKQAIEQEMAAALAEKQFDKCSELQPELDRIVAEIDHRDCGGSVATAAEKLKTTTALFDAARAKKNFKRMAELHADVTEFTEVLDALQRPPAPAPAPADVVADASDAHAASGEEKSHAPTEPSSSSSSSSSSAAAAPPSRLELLLKITAQQGLIDAALAAKRYQECDALNAQLTELQAALAAIPTAASLGRRLKELDTELGTLIAKKFYSKCESVEAEIARLKPLHEKMLQDEREEAAKIGVGHVERGRPKSRRPSITAQSAAASIAPFNGGARDADKAVRPATGNEKPVSKLRPKLPVTVLETETIFSVATAMSARRVDAALLVDAHGRLSGIITDNDITRRVVAEFIDPITTPVSTVMTKSPKCVQQDDSALDALELMVANRFRHLPVMDRDGAVVGLLDIAKCMYEAISALEQVQSTKTDGDLSEAVMMAMQAAGSKKGANKTQLEAMKKMMESMFSGSVPTLKTIIGSEGLPSVRPSANVRDASEVMAKARKGVLVIDDGGKLIGIFTPKDVLNRVVAQGLSADVVTVADAMTANPDTVSADLSLLDALKEMHDHKFLHLPVRESADEHSRVVGLVDVMQLVCSTAGGDGDGAEGASGGSKGWRDFFRDALMQGDNESETSDGLTSSRSGGGGYAAGGGRQRSGSINSVTSGAGGGNRSRANSVSARSRPKPVDDKPVSKLRPKASLMLQETTTVFTVAEAMASKRMDAALLVDASGQLSGIITDNDITRRVVAEFIDPITTPVSTVMTKSPKCVQQDDSALDALELMVANRFRHLPVMDRDGAVVGLLDIAKCMYEAISALEHVHGEQESGHDPLAAGYEAVMIAMQAAGSKKGANKTQLEAMKKVMESMFSGSVPTLKTIIGSEGLPSVRPSANVREASILMAKVRKGVLVIDAEDDLVGIFTPKDLLCRVVAKGKAADLTAVSSVMTANPDTVSADLSLLDALKEMHDHKFLHLPVRESADEHSRVVGLVDVMQLVCSTAGGDGDGGTGSKGWRDFFRDALAARGNGADVSDPSDDNSSHGGHGGHGGGGNGHLRRVPSRNRMGMSRDDRDSDYFPVQSTHSMRSGSYAQYDNAGPSDYAFKVVDKDGNTHRIRSSADSLFLLKMAVGEKLNVLSSSLIIRYVDDEKDEVIISSDSSLRDAVEYARSAGLPALRLTVTMQAGGTAPSSPRRDDAAAAAGDGGGSSNVDGAAAAGTSERNELLETLLQSPKKVREAVQKVPKHTWIMGGAITAVAGIALGGIAMMKGNR